MLKVKPATTQPALKYFVDELSPDHKYIVYSEPDTSGDQSDPISEEILTVYKLQHISLFERLVELADKNIFQYGDLDDGTQNEIEVDLDGSHPVGLVKITPTVIDMSSIDEIGEEIISPFKNRGIDVVVMFD